MPFHCPVCGNDQYEEDHGLFYCVDCGTQSQELIVQETAVNLDINTRYVVREQNKETESSHKERGSHLGRPWTIYEAYQIIILAQAEALVKLGASEDLKETVFMVWANYLSKLGVAFCEKEKLVPTIVLETKIGRLRELSRGSFSNPLNKQMHLHSQRSNSSQQTPQLEDEEFYEDDVLDEEDNIYLDWDEDFDENDDYSSNQTRSSRISKAHISAEWMNMLKTLAISYIGLMISLSDFLPCDVVRWVYEGKVPFLSTTHLLPEDMVLSSRDQALFNTGHLDTDVLIVEINKILTYLRIQDIRPIKIDKLISRFIDELCLPEELKKLCLRLANKIPFLWYRHKSGYHRQELFALSYIILGLRMVFGLDDCQERLLSEYSQELQHLIGQEPKLFVWDEWKNHISHKRYHKFDSYKELTKEISRSDICHLDALLECYNCMERDKKKLSTCFLLNTHQNPVRIYQPEFRNGLRKPLETALERLGASEGTVPGYEERQKRHLNLDKEFRESILSHIVDVPTFKLRCSERDVVDKSKLKKMLKHHRNVGCHLKEYTVIDSEEALSTWRHHSYLWLVQLCSEVVDCSPLELDKRIVRLQEFLAKLTSEEDVSGKVVSARGIINQGAGFRRRAKETLD